MSFNMEEFLERVSPENPELVIKFKTVIELSDEIFSASPELFKKFLQLYLTQYRTLYSMENEWISVNSSCQTDSENKDDIDGYIKNESNDLPTEITENIIESGVINDHHYGFDCDHMTRSHNKLVNSLCQTDGDYETINDWDLNNIVDDVTSEATKDIANIGFTYDHSSGLYYDHKTQCHYNPESKLYYYHVTRSYYRYDEDLGCLQYYCSVPEDSNNNDNPEQEQQQLLNNEKQSIIDSGAKECDKESDVQNENEEDTTEQEEGKCSSSDESKRTLPLPVVIESEPKPFVPDHSKHIAPCIRILVTSTTLKNLRPGTLFIVTCTGGSLGREGDHDVLIPDKLVSKLHSTFRYVYKDDSYSYEIIDMGSKNGTFLDGKRLSEPLVKSLPSPVFHGSVITVGSTDLLCHIHPQGDICEDCQGYNQTSDDTVTNDSATALSIKEKYSAESMAIRKKFGILSLPSGKFPEGYIDRSLNRRKTVGSSHSSEKTQTASVDVAVEKTNKGFLMMTKMGWKEGSSLGKNQDGLIEPITVEIKDGKQGLGCGSAVSGPSTSEAFLKESSQFQSKKDKLKQDILEITRDRYQQLESN